MREDVRDALEAAASAGDEGITRIGLDFRSTPSNKRRAHVRRIIQNFLESLPDDSLSVRDLVNTLDE